MYTEGQFIDFLEKAFGPGQVTGHGGANKNISFLCPICKQTKGIEYSKKKLAVKLGEPDDAGICKCWVCGYRSRNLLDIIKRFRPNFLKEYVDKFVVSKKSIIWQQQNTIEPKNENNNGLSLPDGFKLIAPEFTSFKANRYYTKYLEYLDKRFDHELIESDLWYWKFGISTKDSLYHNRIIMASHDSNGDLNYFTGRAIKYGIKPKYLNPSVPRENIIFNEINIDWQSPLTIVEGPFDLIKCVQNATCLLGSELTTEYKLFELIIKNNTPVYLALDSDAEKKALMIAKLLYAYNIDVHMIKIPHEYKDIGDVPKNMFMDLIEAATLYSMEYCLKAKISTIME